MKRTIKTLITLFTALIIALPAFATGESDEIRTVHIKGQDNMKFDVELIEAKPGETIKIIFETVSNMPPQAMSHNIAIVDLGTDTDAFAQASMSARDNEFIAPDYEDQVIFNTPMLGGGDSVEMEFTVPETKGDYDFVCTFPGHYMAGMVGILRVQ
ncbi:plastocyanin/azurin family copper-binding protein [Rhodohalobacter halophilus]|uniref:plastocyanin/azurin family copper-binding protein n=1 Tax=Rhodohalobacter halophilus TaxID=1812810 RepID=UPI00083FC6FA|nr:plastocyanin/azurin family copper-binding protein [Rhodohalobacter halophilus]